MIKILIAIFGILNFFFAILSVSKIKKTPEYVQFIRKWAFLSGAFVWEDMLAFGTLQFLFALVSIVLDKPVIWIICYLIFWIIRSSGETFYCFLEQFIVPKQYPHNIHDEMEYLRKMFGNISDQKAFILLQVFFQSITIVSTILLILILTKINIWM